MVVDSGMEEEGMGSVDLLAVRKTVGKGIEVVVMNLPA